MFARASSSVRKLASSTLMTVADMPGLTPSLSMRGFVLGVSVKLDQLGDAVAVLTDDERSTGKGDHDNQSRRDLALG